MQVQDPSKRKNILIGTVELECMRFELNRFHASPKEQANRERMVREILRRPELKGFPGFMDRGVLDPISPAFLLGKVELMLEEITRELNSRV